MSTAASLADLLRIKYDINFYTLQQTFYSNRYNALSAKVAQLEAKDDKWNEAFDKAIGNDKELKAGSVRVGKDNYSEALAKYYADAKVGEIDKEVIYELQDKETFYLSVKESTEALLTALRAQEESTKNLVTTNAQDTGLVSGGG